MSTRSPKHAEGRWWEELQLSMRAPVGAQYSAAQEQLLDTIAGEANRLGPTPHWRRPRRPDRLPAYCWAKYTRYGWLFHVLQRYHRAFRVPNRDLTPLIARLARPLGPFSAIPVRALQRLRPWKGIRFPRWQHPKWAAMLREALLSSPVWEIALFLTAVELDLSPRHVWRLIQRARKQAGFTNAQLTRLP